MLHQAGVVFNAEESERGRSYRLGTDGIERQRKVGLSTGN